MRVFRNSIRSTRSSDAPDILEIWRQQQIHMRAVWRTAILSAYLMRHQAGFGKRQRGSELRTSNRVWLQANGVRAKLSATSPIAKLPSGTAGGRWPRSPSTRSNRSIKTCGRRNMIRFPQMKPSRPSAGCANGATHGCRNCRAIRLRNPRLIRNAAN